MSNGYPRILVVGDYIVDHYRFLSPKSLSPEAPIVCFREEHQEFRHGGAGNVAMNLLAWGVEPVLLSSFDMADPVCNSISMPFEKFIVYCEGRKNTVKERLLTTRQQIARIDKQSNTKIDLKTAKKMASAIDKDRFDAIIFSDYDHGVMTPELIREIVGLPFVGEIPIVVDSKAKNTLEKYKRCTIAVPNRDEAKVIGNFDDSITSQDMASKLCASLNSEWVAVTCGAEGAYLSNGKHYPAYVGSDRVVDVTGAGDTFTAMCSLGLSAGWPIDRIIESSNVAAGLKIGKLGVATVSLDEIKEALDGQKKSFGVESLEKRGV